METNIIGLCLVTREAVKLMKKRDEEQDSIGHIVNINSIFGHKIHACVVSIRTNCEIFGKKLLRIEIIIILRKVIVLGILRVTIKNS